MTLFLIVVALLLASAIGLLFFPWATRDDVGHDALNRAFYHARLQEIEQGDPQERDAMVVELQRTLLSDTPAAVPTAYRPQSRWLLLPGALALVVISVGVFLKTSNLSEVNTLRLAQNEFPTLLQRVLNPAERPLRMDEVEQLGLGLRSHLQTFPDDLDAWRLLGRLGMVLNNGDMAMGAFAKASQLAPESAAIALDYAGALICTGDESAVRQGEMKLHDLLKKYPENLRTAAMSQGQPVLNLLENRGTRCDMMARHLAQ
ncbi:c-type cytochrome biogenesis protein CcmI [Pseudocitrobacter cyperus]|uniref:C-type cytochrome biogenesis protein CcmI n=1 Tax=Pseudocitrobacter cyperus TaxID=3112843 RepID=A0ABV0HHZ8_9ENTR